MYVGRQQNQTSVRPMAFKPACNGRTCMPERSDQRLMLDFAAGDAGAFDLLYERYRGPLYRFILRQLKNPVESNDIYQLVWEKAIKSRTSYHRKFPFPAWLFRIARNTVIDHFRRNSSYTDTEFIDMESNQAGPETAAIHEQDEMSLAEAIAALPAEQREVVLLRLEGGLDLGEIASITGANQETCKSRLRYALAKLKSQLQTSDPDAGAENEA